MVRSCDIISLLHFDTAKNIETDDTKRFAELLANEEAHVFKNESIKNYKTLFTNDGTLSCCQGDKNELRIGFIECSYAEN